MGGGAGKPNTSNKPCYQNTDYREDETFRGYSPPTEVNSNTIVALSTLYLIQWVRFVFGITFISSVQKGT